MKRNRFIYLIIKLVHKCKMFFLVVSVHYYRYLVANECKSVGKNVLIYKPISLKGLKYCEIGERFKLDYYGILEAWDYHNGTEYTPKIVIGNNTSFGKNCHIGCINEIIIGNNVLGGSNILIIDHSHGKSSFSELKTPPNSRALFSYGPIHIHDNVWLGDKVTVLPGVTIGENAIIGANTVVTKDVPNNCVFCGTPGKVVKLLCEDK